MPLGLIPFWGIETSSRDPITWWQITALEYGGEDGETSLRYGGLVRYNGWRRREMLVEQNIYLFNYYTNIVLSSMTLPVYPDKYFNCIFLRCCYIST